MASPRLLPTGRVPALALLALLALASCDGSSDAGREPSPTPSPTLSPSLSPATGSSATPTPLATRIPLNDDPLSPRPAIESAPPLGQPVCDPADVTVTDADAVITDHVEEVFVLRTRGEPCELEGFPAVTLLDASGRALDVPVSRSDAQPRPVTMSAGTSLSFTLTTGRTGSCRQAASVRVVLPGTTRSISAATELRACGAVETGPVTRLEDDEDEGAGH